MLENCYFVHKLKNSRWEVKKEKAQRYIRAWRVGLQIASLISMKGVPRLWSSGRNDSGQAHVRTGNNDIIKGLPCHNNEKFG